MTIDKGVWYDWDGYNESLFKSINGYHSNAYDMFMALVRTLTAKENVPYYIGALAVWCVIGFIIKKIRSTGGVRQYVIRSISTLLVLAVSFVADGVLVHNLKQEFAFPRPYVALPSGDVHMSEYSHEKTGEDNMSFPSGHTSIITVLVIGAWPILSEAMRWFGMSAILLVALASIAVGMHFPADVLGGFVIGLCVTVISRVVIHRVLGLFKIRC